MRKRYQVCLFEQGRLLRKLGIDAPSIHRHYHYCTKKQRDEFFEVSDIVPYDMRSCVGIDTYNAYTTSELMSMMPDNKWAVPYRCGVIDLKSDVFTEAKIVITKYSTGYEASIVSIDKYVLKSFTHAILAVALSDLLIYLLQNGLVSIEQTNQSIIEEF
jgi:hypothetical protein